MPKREHRTPRRVDWKTAFERMARRELIPVIESLSEVHGSRNGNGKGTERNGATDERLGSVETALNDFGIRLARDQERVESRVSELESERDTFRTLYELSTIIDAERDLHLLVEGVVDALLSLFDVERILLVLIDEAGQVKFSLGKDQSKKRFPAPEDGLIRQSIDSCCGAHTPVHIVGYLEDEGDKAARLSVYAVPLLAHDRALGCVILALHDTLAGVDHEHRQLLGQIAVRLAQAIERNRRYMQLKASRAKLLEDLRGKFQFDEILGNSPEMTTLLKTAAEVAQTDAAVLVEGESGTGKELLARAIHHNSPRADQPFVPINCAAIPENLLESELFGFEKGAFTGADKRKIGKFEAADGGTIFLDEIGEMPSLLQVKLLRFLQSHEFERLGSTVTRYADVRIISATNRELITLVNEGSFREDLYYRVNVINLKVPPLRRRQSDIAPLAESFVHKSAKRQGKTIGGLSAEALACLSRYDFPGNIRELENIIERAVILARGELVTPGELPETILQAGETKPTPLAVAESYPDLKRRRLDALNEVDRAFVARLLERHKFNISQAAQAAGMHRFELQRLIRKLKKNGRL